MSSAIAFQVPEFLKTDPALSEIHYEALDKLNEEKEKEMLKALTIPHQKIAVRYISDAVLCAELQRRLMGRKSALNVVESLAESVRLTEV